MVRRGYFECGGPHYCPDSLRRNNCLRASTSQLNLLEVEEGVELDMDVVVAKYGDDEEEAIVRAGASITTWPTCLTIKLNNTRIYFLK